MCIFWHYWNSFIYLSNEVQTIKQKSFSKEILCKIQKSFYAWINIFKCFIWDTGTSCYWACLPSRMPTVESQKHICPQTPLDSLNNPLWIWWSNIFTFFCDNFYFQPEPLLGKRFHKLSTKCVRLYLIIHLSLCILEL